MRARSIAAWILVGCHAPEASLNDEVALSDTSPPTAEAETEGEGPPLECADLARPSSDPIELRVRNARERAVYLNVGCGPILWLGRASWLVVKDPDRCELPACSAALEGDCSGGCGQCIPSLVRLDPGDVYSEAWSGTVFEREEVPAPCDLCTDRCWQEYVAPEDDYTVGVEVLVDCPASATRCECPDGTASPCFIESEDDAIVGVYHSTAFRMPTLGPVEIVIP